MVTQVTVTLTHSPLPPLKLPSEPRPTFSMKPLALLPSGMNRISFFEYAELKLNTRLGAGEKAKLPRAPPDFAELVGTTPSSLL